MSSTSFTDVSLDPPLVLVSLGRRSRLGLEPDQVVEREPYDLLFGERKAPDGTPLGRPPGSGRKAADIYARLLGAERTRGSCGHARGIHRGE
jgi:hypothetical protein